MSSSHLIILARHTETGELRLPLDDMTLYGTGEEQSVVKTCAQTAYTDEWALELYGPMGGQEIGQLKRPTHAVLRDKDGKDLTDRRIDSWGINYCDIIEYEGRLFRYRQIGICGRMIFREIQPTLVWE